MICPRHRRSTTCGTADPHVHREHGQVFCAECFAEALRYANLDSAEKVIRRLQGRR